MKLLALVAVIGPGVDPRVVSTLMSFAYDSNRRSSRAHSSQLVRARVEGSNLFPPRGRGASQAALKSKGLQRAGVQNIDTKNVPCIFPSRPATSTSSTAMMN